MSPRSRSEIETDRLKYRKLRMRPYSKPRTPWRQPALNDTRIPPRLTYNGCFDHIFHEIIEEEENLSTPLRSKGRNFNRLLPKLLGINLISPSSVHPWDSNPLGVKELDVDVAECNGSMYKVPPATRSWVRGFLDNTDTGGKPYVEAWLDWLGACKEEVSTRRRMTIEANLLGPDVLEGPYIPYMPGRHLGLTFVKSRTTAHAIFRWQADSPPPWGPSPWGSRPLEEARLTLTIGYNCRNDGFSAPMQQKAPLVRDTMKLIKKMGTRFETRCGVALNYYTQLVFPFLILEQFDGDLSAAELEGSSSSSSDGSSDGNGDGNSDGNGSDRAGPQAKHNCMMFVHTTMRLLLAASQRDAAYSAQNACNFESVSMVFSATVANNAILLYVHHASPPPFPSSPPPPPPPPPPHFSSSSSLPSFSSSWTSLHYGGGDGGSSCGCGSSGHNDGSHQQHASVFRSRLWRRYRLTGSHDSKVRRLMAFYADVQRIMEWAARARCSFIKEAVEILGRPSREDDVDNGINNSNNDGFDAAAAVATATAATIAATTAAAPTASADQRQDACLDEPDSDGMILD